jgi:pectate lyase
MKFTLALAANFLVGAAVAAPGLAKDCKESFGLEGFAKENPLGVTTGGKGGPTTTVTAAAALATAVLVRNIFDQRSIRLASISDSSRAKILSPLSLRVTLTFLRASWSAPTRALLAMAKVQLSLAKVSLSKPRIM